MTLGVTLGEERNHRLSSTNKGPGSGRGRRSWELRYSEPYHHQVESGSPFYRGRDRGTGGEGSFPKPEGEPHTDQGANPLASTVPPPPSRSAAPNPLKSVCSAFSAYLGRDAGFDSEMYKSKEGGQGSLSVPPQPPFRMEPFIAH